MPGFAARTTRNTAAEDRAAPHSNRGDLRGGVVGAQAIGGMHQQRGDVCRLLAGNVLHGAQEKCGHKRRNGAVVGITSFAGFEVFPANDRDGIAGTDTGTPKQVRKRRGGVTRLTHQAERLVEDDLHRKTGDLGVDQALVADQQDAAVVGAEEQERLFEPGIEPGEEYQIGEVLAVAVDRHPPRASPLVQGAAAGFVLGPRDRRKFLGDIEVG